MNDARINFALPEALKAAIEDAAKVEHESVSVWLRRISVIATRKDERTLSERLRGARS